MAKLVVLSEGFTGLSHELKAAKTTIGRVEENSFQIAEASVSSHHAEIQLRGSDVVVKDLNSTNGTFVNNERVTETVLKPGQILRLGQVEIRLETGAPPTTDKKKLSQTMVIPQGVKVDELVEHGTQPKGFDEGPFTKKTNRANLLFLVGAILLILIIIGLMVFAYLQITQTPGGGR